MFYRVVLQGRAAGDHDLATVKREFARVTGMPENVTERVFALTPRTLTDHSWRHRDFGPIQPGHGHAVCAAIVAGPPQ